MCLFVQPTGTRSWVQRLVIRGRRRELGLGAATLVPLAKAREQALANRKLARSGGDPLSEKRRVQGVPTFADAAQRVLEQKRGGWRGRCRPTSEGRTTRWVALSIVSTAGSTSRRSENASSTCSACMIASAPCSPQRRNRGTGAAPGRCDAVQGRRSGYS